MKTKRTYVSAHPDFSEVIIFHRFDAVSFRNATGRKLYGAKIKGALLSRIDCENWPYSQPIMVAIGISGQPEQYRRRDLDNMAKVILDAGDKIIYTDDHLVHILLVQKQIWSIAEHGFMVGIRALTQGGKDKYTPNLISSANVPGKSEDAVQPVIFAYEIENGEPNLRHVKSEDEQ